MKARKAERERETKRSKKKNKKEREQEEEEDRRKRARGHTEGEKATDWPPNVNEKDFFRISGLWPDAEEKIVCLQPRFPKL